MCECSPVSSFETLKILLPTLQSAEDQYRVCRFEETSPHSFTSNLRLPFSTEGQVSEWLKDFQKSSLITWRIDRTFPHSGRKNVYRVDLRCQHNTKPRSTTADLRKGSKNTCCPASMSITVKRSSDARGRIRTKDSHIKDGFFTTVSLTWNHNHELSSADAFKVRDVSDEAVQKLLDLFQAGYNPTAALDTLKYDLQEKYSTVDYVKISADRSICPDLPFCYRLFYKEFEKHYGQAGNQDMMVTLEEKLREYNSTKDEESTQTCTASLHKELGAVFDDFTHKLQTNPTEYRKAIETFIGSYRKMTTDSQLVSAMHTFGKNIVTSKHTKRKSFHSSQKIGVQPTAISRRKMAMGGKRRVNSGRPSKASFVREHGYNKRKTVSSFQQYIPAKRRVAPHSLSLCVSENVTLGKTHSSK